MKARSILLISNLLSDTCPEAVKLLQGNPIKIHSSDDKQDPIRFILLSGQNSPILSP